MGFYGAWGLLEWVYAWGLLEWVYGILWSLLNEDIIAQWMWQKNSTNWGYLWFRWSIILLFEGYELEVKLKAKTSDERSMPIAGSIIDPNDTPFF